VRALRRLAWRLGCHGDARRSAKLSAAQLGITRVIAEVRPGQAGRGGALQRARGHDHAWWAMASTTLSGPGGGDVWASTIARTMWAIAGQRHHPLSVGDLRGIATASSSAARAMAEIRQNSFRFVYKHRRNVPWQPGVVSLHRWAAGADDRGAAEASSSSRW